MEKKLIEHINIQINKILFDEYKRLGIDEESLVLLLKLIDLSQDNYYQLDVAHLEERTTLKHPQILSIIQKLIDKQLIEMSTVRQDGNYTEVIDISGLYDRLYNLLTVTGEENKNELGELFSYIEQLYGRTLSGAEYQRLKSWLEQDGKDPAAIKEAVDLAYTNQITSLQYVERVLQNTKTRDQSKSDELPMMEWLKGDNIND